MAGKSDYLETAFLNHMFRTATLSKPGNVFFSLHTADPGDTGLNEISGGAYARVQIATGDANFSAPTASGDNMQISNSIAITWPTPTANWGTATHFGIWDALTGGNYLRGGALGTARTINNGDTAPTFAPGSVTIGEG